jgi:hypothetical protein
MSQLTILNLLPNITFMAIFANINAQAINSALQTTNTSLVGVQFQAPTFNGLPFQVAPVSALLPNPNHVSYPIARGLVASFPITNPPRYAHEHNIEYADTDVNGVFTPIQVVGGGTLPAGSVLKTVITIVPGAPGVTPTCNPPIYWTLINPSTNTLEYFYIFA